MARLAEMQLAGPVSKSAISYAQSIEEPRRNGAGKKVIPLTPNQQNPDRLLERQRVQARPTARIILAALLTCAVTAATGISSPAQTSQPESKPQATSLTKSIQIDRRRIGPVILAASGPTGHRLRHP